VLLLCYNQTKGKTMQKQDINDRLSELGIYSAYYYRLETKVLAKMLNPDEKLLCVLTGVYKGSRQMLAVTDFRMIIIQAGAISAGQVKVVKRKALTSWNFNKRFLLSVVTFSTDKETFEFRQTQAARKDLFDKAMNTEIKEFDE